MREQEEKYIHILSIKINQEILRKLPATRREILNKLDKINENTLQSRIGILQKDGVIKLENNFNKNGGTFRIANKEFLEYWRKTGAHKEDFYKALKNKKRIQIIDELKKGSMTIKDIMNLTGLSQPAACVYTGYLVEAKLVQRSKEGKKYIYRLAE